MSSQKNDQEKRKGPESDPNEIPKKKTKYDKEEKAVVQEKTVKSKKPMRECPACHKTVNSLFKITMDDDCELSCRCGHEWTLPDDVIYCSKKCQNKNSYWMLYGDTLIVEDECNGCGIPIVFDVQVKKEFLQ